MRTLLLLMLLGATGSATLSAQEITGAITGVVTDQSGAVVPGATVTVRNVSTNIESSMVTDASGVYLASNLPVGQYEVKVELAGFRTYVRSDLEVHVADRLRVNPVLQTGAVSETVTVTGASPVVQTETSDVSTLINGTQVTQMPLNGRNVVQLVAMQPGVSSTLPSTLGVGLSSLVNVFVNGARSSQNNWMIDGADNNDAGSNLGLINYVNVDAVSEVKILRSNYSAEFGRSAGGQINIVTKSGTNDVHGSLFEFVRNDALDARNPFSFIDFDGDGKPDPSPLKYHNFGGTIGGPIVKNRLFAFWAEEGRRITSVRGGGVAQARVPTDRQRAGDFSEFAVTIIDPLTGAPFPGNQIPANRIDPLAKGLLNRFPAPNAAAGGTLNYSTATPQIRNFREELPRVDYRISDAHLVYGRAIIDTIPSEEPFGEVFGTSNAAFPGVADTKTDTPGRSFVGTWNWIVGPRTVNEISYNYSRGGIFSEITGNASRDVAIPKVFKGSPGDALLPGIVFGGGTYGIPSGQTNAGRAWDFFGPYDNSYGSHRIKDTVTRAIGAHALKFGGLYSYEFKNENAASGTNGVFTFPGTTNASFTSTGDAFADFLLGRASTYSETNIDITSHLRFQMFEAFVQDDWKVRPNLTLNLGLRWSAILQPIDTNDLLTNFDPGKFDPTKAYQIDAANQRVPGTGDPLNGIIIAGQNSPYGRRVVDSHWSNFGPRAGFSWDPFQDGKTAVRAGYGMYFDRTLVGIALQNAFVNPPFAFSAVFNAAGAAVPTLSNPQNGTQRNNEALVPNLIAMSPDFKIPTTHQYSVGVQRQLSAHLNLDVAYVGSQGRNLLWNQQINQTPVNTPSPTNAARPYRGYGNINMRSTSATSSYNSLQVSVVRRLFAGLQLNGNYTLSKAVSDASADRGTTQQDIRNLSAERALTNYDRTHILGVHYVWELPFYRDAGGVRYNVLGGWEISGSTRYATGLPLTITTTTNRANSFGGGTLRPDLVGDPEGAETVAEWFNKAAFALPAAGQFGNAPNSVVRGPGVHLTDLGVFKNFKITDRVRAQYRLEMFNAFNHTQYSAVGTSLDAATFGRVTTANEPRLIEMAIKLTF
jgi:carboxypeptidase family protein/TonB-dependent receptor-like protein